MFDRHDKPTGVANFAVVVAVSLMGGALSSSAVAATSGHIPCSELTEATLNIPDNVFVTELVNSEEVVLPIGSESPKSDVEVAASSTLLGPRAEEAIRNAFLERDAAAIEAVSKEVSSSLVTPPMAGTDSQSDASSESQEDDSNNSEMNAKLPGISDDDLSRYKKQMYRRDI